MTIIKKNTFVGNREGTAMANLTIKEVVEGYKKKSISPVELIKDYLERINRFDPKLHSFITVNEEMALFQAAMLEKKIMANENISILQGIPFTYKDNIDTKAIRTTNGSLIDKNHIPEKDAEVVKTLAQLGVVNMGKVNLSEYAFGITSNNPFYGTVRNPWNSAYSAGGSSSGSAAAVAANLCLGSIGTDTAGSIRVPSSCCGVVGLKPTHGKISTKGVMPLSWTLDHVGPISRNVYDSAMIMHGLTGQPYEKQCHTDIRGLRIGVPRQFFTEKIDDTVYKLYKKTLRELEHLGAILIEIDVPIKFNPIDITTMIATSEVGYVHSQRRHSSLHLYGEGASQTFNKSDSISAYQYIQALKAREEMTRGISALFENVDVMATPTMPAQPPLIDAKSLMIAGDEESVDDYMIRYTCLFDITGHPALTVPAGLNEDLIPIGVQFISNHHREDLLYKTAFAYEQNNLIDFYSKRDESYV